MARVKCESCGRPRSVRYSAVPYAPVGHPNSGLICGSKSCRNPGLVWLLSDEERAYHQEGERIFPFNNETEKGVKFHVTGPHSTAGDGRRPVSTRTSAVAGGPQDVRRSSTRLNDLKRFYRLLDQLRARVGGWRRLADCDAKRGWPQRGVYFFFEDGEVRSSTGDGPRVVRVGTHALRRGDETSLWSRLRSHRGVVKSGGGNHRGSVFRLLIGTALLQRDSRLAVGTWGRGSKAPRDVRDAEKALECRVSDLIRRMPFLWLDVPDAPGPNSLRAMVERNSIALLSNAQGRVLDAASSAWLGRDCSREAVRRSGLWNSDHTKDTYDPAFLDALERLVVEGD